MKPRDAFLQEWARYERKGRAARDAYHGRGARPGLKETVDRRYLGSHEARLVNEATRG